MKPLSYTHARNESEKIFKKIKRTRIFPTHSPQFSNFQNPTNFKSLFNRYFTQPHTQNIMKYNSYDLNNSKGKKKEILFYTKRERVVTY
jgi:hypothetical protein